MRKLLLLLSALSLAAFALWRLHILEAALLLSDLGAGAQPTLYKKLTPQPERRPISFGPHKGDLYLPAEKAGAAIVLVPGAAKEGKNDPRLVNLATSLARARFLVLVPDLPSVRALEVSAADREPILDAVHYILDDRKPPAVGIAAISYAAGPALLAALAEPRVDFVVSVGGYYDLPAVLTFFTTGRYRDGAGQPWLTGTPNDYGKWVFVRANARRLDDSADRALLAGIAERKMADLNAPIDDLSAKLSPQGRAVMAMLNNADPAKVGDLIDKLPPGIRAEIDRMDLAGKDLSQLKARLIAVHGRDDRIIPWTESAALARMAPKADLVLLDNLAHADLKAGGLADALALGNAVRLLLEQRP